MRKNLIRNSVVVGAVTALAVLPMAHTASAASSDAKPAASAEAKKGPDTALNVNFDVLGIAESIADSIKKAENREGFVKNLMNTAWYEGGEKYNVVVRNLSQDYDENVKGVKLYGSAEYDGITYGIWVFEDGEFTNKGDGGWINWAFRGYFDRYDEDGNEKDDGAVVKFRKG